MSTSKQKYINRTGHVRVDLSLIRLTKIKAARSGETIRSLTEYGLGIVNGIDEYNLGDKND